MKKPIILFTAIICIASCQKDSITNQEIKLPDMQLEVAGESFSFKGFDDTYYLGFGDLLFTEQDIEFLKERVISSKRGKYLRGAYRNARWSCNRIYYKFDKNVSSTMRTKITTVFSTIENNTKIDFRYAALMAPRESYVHIEQYTGKAGQATIGQSNAGLLRIGSYATPREILHEIGHIVGLEHEHQRSDGENYLVYCKSNTKSGLWDFIKPLSHAIPVGSMDWASVMMYHGCAASKDSGGVTGQCTPENATHYIIGGGTVSVNNAATAYSAGDFEAMNTLYALNISCSGGGGDDDVIKPPIEQ